MISLWILIPITLNSALAQRHLPADFESLSKDPLYVDKTQLIDRYLNLRYDLRYQLITSPPGFMKSTNLDMIKRFVQIEVDDKGVVKPKNQTRNFLLFNDEKFAIKTYDILYHTHLAEYPVVHLKLSDVAGPTISDILNKMSTKIRECYEDYKWLYLLYDERYPDDYYVKNSTIPKSHKGFMSNFFCFAEDLPATVIQESVSKLVEILHWYFNKQVIVLIDDYDAPVIDTAINKEHHTNLSLVKNIIDQIIGSMFKPEIIKYIDHVLILGTNSVPLSLKNSSVIFNPFLHNKDFSPLFAITEDELSAKLTQLNHDNSSIADIKAKFGGYKPKKREPIFGKPDSITRFLKNETNDDIPADSWIDRGSLTTLSVFLNNVKIRTRIEELINGSGIVFQVERPVDMIHYQKLDAIIRGLGDVNDFNADVFFTILLENGYLGYDVSTESYLAPFWRYKIPNEEVLEAFKKFYSLYEQCSNMEVIAEVEGGDR